jgi:membrane-bound lytic murein transglycosylase MltF
MQAEYACATIRSSPLRIFRERGILRKEIEEMSTARNFALLLAAFLFAALALPWHPQEGFAGEASDTADKTRAELELLNKPWKGDLEDMLKRRIIRALVVYSKTQYYVDKGTPVGMAYEGLKAFEDYINKKFPSKQKHLKCHIVFLPVARDELIPALLEGRGDVAAAGLTITSARAKLVDFSDPTARNISEIAVIGPKSPPIVTLDDLSDKEVFLRKSSSYWEHVEQLNTRFRKEGKRPVKLLPAPEELQDEDLLEMVNAGVVGVTIVDDYAANLWAKVFKDIRPLPETAVNTGGELAWMFRKDSPKLKSVINDFMKTHRQGTLFGNTIIKKYTAGTKFIKNATSSQEIEKFRKTVDIFRKYGDEYDVDYLLAAAQGYQESRLDQTVKSPVGAIGIMQLMPATGKEMKVGDIQQVDPNIHAGVKYIRFMVDHYFDKEPMTRQNKVLFAFAAYNAGPGRIAQMRREAARRGLDPNVWFNNVEMITAEKVGSETVTYVSNIYKYYIAYKLATREVESRQKAKEQLQDSKK